MIQSRTCPAENFSAKFIKTNRNNNTSLSYTTYTSYRSVEIFRSSQANFNSLNSSVDATYEYKCIISCVGIRSWFVLLLKVS